MTTVKKYNLTRLFFIILTLGIFLRFYQIGTESYWIDEVTMVTVTNFEFEETAKDLSRGRPAIVPLIGNLWVDMFGSSEVATRTLSAIPSVVAIVLIYMITNELFDRRIALIAMFLTALSGFQISEAQNFRYYSVLVMFTTMSYYYYWRMLQHDKMIDFVIYVLSTILVFYSHSHGMFVVFAQSVYWSYYNLLENRKFRFKLIFDKILITIGILPGLIILYLMITTDSRNNDGVALGWINIPSLFAPIQTMIRYLFYQVEYFHPLSWFAGILFLALTTGLHWVRVAHSKVDISQLDSPITLLKKYKSALMFVLPWLLVTIFTPFVLSYFVLPLYVDRYMMAASTAFYILVAFVIVSLQRVIPVVASVGMLTIIIGFGLYQYYLLPQNEDWRGIASYIEQNVQSDDILLFVVEDNTPRTFRWYFGSALPDCQITLIDLHESVLQDETRDCLSDYDDIWIITRLYPNDRSRRIQLQWLADELIAQDYGKQSTIINFTDVATIYIK